MIASSTGCTNESDGTASSLYRFGIRAAAAVQACRQVRRGRAGSGKSGGVRVVYFMRAVEGEVVLLTLYAKAKTDNLTGTKLKEIRHALEK